VLSGANTYSGATTVSAGVLNLQNNAALGTTTGGTTVASGATLQTQGGITVTNETLTLSGTGYGGIGALNNLSGTTSLAGNITLAADTLIYSAAGQLRLGNEANTQTISTGTSNLTFDGAGDIWVNSNITGTTTGVTKNGTGTLTFYGFANSYTGTTTVSNGTLVVDTDTGHPQQGIPGNLVIGDGAGLTSSAVVQFGQGATPSANNLISNTASVSIYGDGLLNLNNQVETIGSLAMTGGTVTTGTGILYLNGNVTGNAASTPATINGILSLGSGVRTFTIASGTASPADMVVNAKVQDGSLIKNGAGRLLLTGSNTYTGTTTVSAGELAISNASALGDTSSGTVVSNGAALEVQGGISVGTEALTLNGTGVSGGGALRNISDANSWAGPVNLASASRVNVDSGTLTLSGAVSSTGQNLTVGGAGTTDVSGAVVLGAGSLAKDGSGTLFLSGNNTYTGGTSISAGVVNASNNYALGGLSAGTTTVAAGAALQLQGGITVPSAPLVLNGTGIANDGALRNISGNNTWSGSVTLGSAARINSDAGTLTVSGGIGGSGQNLTVGGAGNTVLAGNIATTTGSVTKDGSGTVVLSGTNNYTGGTNINGGTLQLGTNNAVANGAVAVASGATFNLNGYADTIGALSGTGTLQLASGTLIAGSGGASSTFAGSFAIGDTGTFEKTGSGTLTLGSSINFGSGSLVLAGGELSLGGFTSTFSSLTVTGNSTLDFAGTSILNLSSVAVNSGVTLTISNWSDTIDYFFSQVNPGSANLGRIVFTGFTGPDTKWLTWDNEISPVPEPADYGAVLIGFSLLAAFWCRVRARRGRS